MDFSNREIASLVWLVAFVVYFSRKGDGVTRAFKGVLRAFFASKIIAVVAWAALWIIMCVHGLRYVGVWEAVNLKTTIIWALTFAFVTLFDIGRISEDHTYFRKTVRDSVNATVAVTFIAELYSLPLAAELILIPILMLMAGIQAFSENDPKNAPAYKLSSWVLVFVSVAYIGYGVYKAASYFQAFATWNNLREFSIPILLSLSFLPYLYLVSVLVSYELVFTRLRWALKDDALRRYAAFQAILRFRFDLEALRRWKRHAGSFRPDSREAIRSSIAEVKAQQEKERNPPHVALDQG